MRPAPLATLALPCLLGDCAPNTPAPAAPDVELPPLDFQEFGETLPSDELPRGVAEGRPVALKDDGPEAAWLWHDDAAWHLRVTFSRAPRRVRGVVWGMASGDHWTFDLRAQGNTSRLDWHSDGAPNGGRECAWFQILVDGEWQGDVLKIGKDGLSPKRRMFGVCQR